MQSQDGVQTEQEVVKDVAAINFIQTQQTVNIISNPFGPSDLILKEENQLKKELASIKDITIKPNSSDYAAQSELQTSQIVTSAQDILIESIAANLARSLQAAEKTVSVTAWSQLAQ
jgi:hypothetical protein